MPNSAYTDWLTPNLLTGMQRGIEKEGLRVSPNGRLSTQPHPEALGSKLAHPAITTDYSEALLELITEPHDTIEGALGELAELHRVVAEALPKGELIWPLSMPCLLASEDDQIPLADYGTANIAKLKTLYRRGLGLRYGRRMQTIAGLHYNLSFPKVLFSAMRDHSSDGKNVNLTEFTDQAYLGLIRNMKRQMPLILYFFGASPSVCPCFVTGRSHALKPLNSSKNTYGLADATSLRMGRLGYQNSAQDDLAITYNNLPTYIKGLRRALTIKHPPFSKIGVDDKTGAPQQINDHILQIENEFYSTLRPKQITRAGESPTDALQARGIAYVELRALDLDPYDPYGLSSNTAHFVELLMLHALLSPSPELGLDEEQLLARNQELVTEMGVKSDLYIEGIQGEVLLRDWIREQLNPLEALAKLLDQTQINTPFEDALTVVYSKFNDTDLLPARRVLSSSAVEGGIWKLGQRLASEHFEEYLKQPLPEARAAHYRRLASASIHEQNRLEAEPQASFTEFLAPYRDSAG